jgi:colanic acid biosynthesis glycosyl transferase WcaI
MDPNINPRLWLISELYFPEVTSTGYYMTEIGSGLAENTQVKVICGQPNYFARDIRAPRREKYNGVDISRVAGTRFNKNIIALKLINMLSLGISIFFESLFSFRKGDKVLVVTTPPVLPFVAGIASLIRGTSYTLLIHDNYPEMVIAVGKTRSGSIFARSVEFANRWLFKHAAKIIVVGRDMQQLLLKKTAGLNIPIAIIPNWAEIDSVTPQSRESNELLKDCGIAEKFVFLYAGNMGRPNDIESLIKAADLLREETSLHFVFLGDGAKRRWLEQQIADLCLPNVTILPPQPREDQINFLNACDVGIVSLVSGMLGVSMPSRTYNLLAAGKPILAITETGSEIELVVSENDVGWIVPPDSPEKLADTIRTIYSSRTKLNEMGTRARLAAETEYGLQKALERYRKELLQKPANSKF